jgi:hypothetical protein
MLQLHTGKPGLKFACSNHTLDIHLRGTRRAFQFSNEGGP